MNFANIEGGKVCKSTQSVRFYRQLMDSVHAVVADVICNFYL
jgi:hypothetical protein